MEKIQQADLVGRGVIGLPDTPGLTAAEMQRKFEETAREVIVPKFNALVDELSGYGAASVGAVGPDGEKTTVQAELGALQEKAEQGKQIGTAAGESAQEAQRAAEEAMEEAKAKAPENHASTGVDYGVADSGRFGHVKLSDSLIEAVGGQGVAASQKAVNTVYEYAKTLNDKVGAAVRYTPQALTLAQKAQARENIGAVSLDEISVATPDWSESDPRAKSYIKNRTHWKEKTSENGVLLEEVTVEFRMEMASVSGIGTDGIKKGGKYLVDWNGTRYDCEAYELAGSVCLGNAALLGGENDTGEPFAIEAITADGCTLVKNTSTAESVTLAVTGVENTVWHQLDPRFIPDMYYTEGGGGEVILPETQATFLENSTFAIQNAIDGVTAGEKYTVGYNGVEYETVAVEHTEDGITVAVLGNLSAGPGGADTGEPFAMIVLNADFAAGMGFGAMIMPLDGATSVTVSITSGSAETIHKLDNKYLDLDWLPVQKLSKCAAVMAEKTSALSSWGRFTFRSAEQLPLMVGKTYIINWNGVEYASEFLAYTGGDSEIYGQFESDAFVIWQLYDASEASYKNALWCTPKDGSTELTLSIYEAGNVNKMPAEFLPETVTVDLSGMPTLVTGEDVSQEVDHRLVEQINNSINNGGKAALVIPFQPKTSAGTGDVINYTAVLNGDAWYGRWMWSGTYINGSAVHEISLELDSKTDILYAKAREATGSGSGSGSLPEGFDPLAVVSTKAQSFTPEQQAQARTNIGAASKEEAANASNAANSAGEKAVAAENTAAAAKNTAEAAAAAADEARTEAGEAVQTAAEAKETAEQATANAANAVSVANSAKAAAQTAANTANSAAAAANQAAQGAAEAKATANKAAEDAAAAKSSAAAAEDSAASALAVANQKAPENHASGSDKYGLGSRTDYGHVLIRDTIADEETTGAAASPEGVARAIAAAKQEVLQEVLDTQQADWSQNDAAAANYVKNRTHWVEDGGEVEVVSNNSLQLNESNGVRINVFEYKGDGFAFGQTYIVYWNGVRYECVSRYWSDEDTSVCIGNRDKAHGKGDTGEPFLLSYNDEPNLCYVYAFDGTTQLDLTVNTFEKVYHKLPEEYLPESVDGVVIRSSTEGSTKKFRLTVDDSGIITATEV